MARKIIYQTLEDRGNREQVEKNGPFVCKWENTWLGDGYYFWDTFIDNAHWWGHSRNYKNGYIICKADCKFDTSNCLDLVGNTEQIQLFNDAYELLKSKKLVDSSTTVARVIAYLKMFTKNFNYDAIRVYGIESKSQSSRYHSSLSFEDDKRQYLDLKPAIQICIYDKFKLDLKNYKIIFPDEYIEGFVV